MKSASDRAGEVWITAFRKIGFELEKLPKAKGVIGRNKKGQTRGSKGEPRVDEPATLKELGVSKKRASRAKKLASMDAEELKENVDALHDRRPVLFRELYRPGIEDVIRRIDHAQRTVRQMLSRKRRRLAL